MSEELKKNRENISSLNEAFSKCNVSKDDSYELAFNYGDIANEIIEVGQLLEKAINSRSITEEELNRLNDVVCIHWLYHINELHSIYSKLDEEE